MKENFRFRVSIYFHHPTGQNYTSFLEGYIITKDELIDFLKCIDNTVIACFVKDYCNILEKRHFIVKDRKNYEENTDNVEKTILYLQNE